MGLYEREKSHELATESLGRVTQSKVGEGGDRDHTRSRRPWSVQILFQVEWAPLKAFEWKRNRIRSAS